MHGKEERCPIKQIMTHSILTRDISDPTRRTVAILKSLVIVGRTGHVRAFHHGLLKKIVEDDSILSIINIVVMIIIEYFNHFVDLIDLIGQDK